MLLAQWSLLAGEFGNFGLNLRFAVRPAGPFVCFLHLIATGTRGGEIQKIEVILFSGPKELVFPGYARRKESDK